MRPRVETRAEEIIDVVVDLLETEGYKAVQVVERVNVLVGLTTRIQVVPGDDVVGLPPSGTKGTR